jgi:hypothetical protein
MDLIKDKWIPTSNGRVSLLDVFTESKASDFSGDAQEIISLYRFLIALTTRAIELSGEDWDDGEDLAALGVDGMSEVVVKYLETQSFQLFDKDRPWLQLPESVFPATEPGCKLPLGRLREHFSEGGNACFRNEQRCISMADEEIAMGVLVTQVYSPGYKTGQKSLIYGRATDVLNVAATPNFAYGGGSFVTGIQHIYLKGTRLVDSIFMSLLDKESLEDNYPAGLGTPYWEHDHTSKYEESDTYYARMIPAFIKAIRVDKDTDTLYYAGILTSKECAVRTTDTTYHLVKQVVDNSKKVPKGAPPEMKSVLQGVPNVGMFWKEIGAQLIAYDKLHLLDREKLEEYDKVIVRSLGSLPKESMGLYQTQYLENSSLEIPLGAARRSFVVKYQKGIKDALKIEAKISKAAWIYASSIQESSDSKSALNKLTNKIKNVCLNSYWNALASSKDVLREYASGSTDDKDWKSLLKNTAADSMKSLSSGGVRQMRAYSKAINYLRSF